MICFSARLAFRYAAFHLAHCRIATLYTSPQKLVELIDQDQHSQPPPKTYQLRNNLLTLETQLEAQCIQSYHDQLEYFGNESSQSYQLKDILLTENINRMRLLGTFGIRGGLEHLVYHAILDQKIPSSSGNGIHQGLDALTGLEEFRTIFAKEAKARAVDGDTIMDSLSDLYDKHPQVQCRNHKHLILSDYHWASCTVVPLVALMKMQCHWSHPIPWKFLGSQETGCDFKV
ncbi:hypothetical protein HOY82DRAFT_649732 [Tuber indicum]|nr:hypothetical protein HOY82DRAFT_649732 [Tuber indicum]